MRKQAYLFAMIVATILTTACSSGDEPQPAADTTTEGTLTPVFGTVTDINGNVYKTVTVGTQTWMAENLRVNKYNDGTPLKRISKPNEWQYTRKSGRIGTPAYCWYKNDSATHSKPFGAYYNGYVLEIACNGGRNIAPKGWHVATYWDWNKLDKLVKSVYASSYDYLTFGRALASKTGTSTDIYGWSPNVKERGIGNHLELNNTLGLNIYPNGGRNGYETDEFYKQGVNAFLWSMDYTVPFTVSLISEDVWLAYLAPDHNEMRLPFGQAIRCVKD